MAVWKNQSLSGYGRTASGAGCGGSKPHDPASWEAAGGDERRESGDEGDAQAHRLVYSRTSAFCIDPQGMQSAGDAGGTGKFIRESDVETGTIIALSFLLSYRADLLAISE